MIQKLNSKSLENDLLHHQFTQDMKVVPAWKPSTLCVFFCIVRGGDHRVYKNNMSAWWRGGHEGHMEGGCKGHMGTYRQGVTQPLCWVSCRLTGQLMLTCTPTLMYPYPVPWGVPETLADP